MTTAQRFTIASSLSRYRRPMWTRAYWPAAVVIAWCAGYLAAQL